jgi:hypothetical protein
MRALLFEADPESPSIGSDLQVNNWTIKARPTQPKDFDPQTGTIQLKTIVFLINLGGTGPGMTTDVSGTWRWQ